MTDLLNGASPTPLIIAGVGAVLINLLRLAELSGVKKEDRPDFKDFIYWLPFLVWPVVSVFLAWIYVQMKYDMNPLMSLQVGASSPLIMRAIGAAVPKRLSVPPDA